MVLFKNNWGQWTDLSSGSLGPDKYILQGRRHKNGKIQMRVEHTRAYGTVHPTLEQLEKVNLKK